MCMILDESHRTTHKNYIKPLQEMRAFVIDRCNDKFVSEISLITQDLTAKFSSKINASAVASTSLTAEILSKKLPVSIASLQGRFNQKLTTPVHSLAERAQGRIEAIAIASQDLVHKDLEEELSNSIQFIEQKGREEKGVWDTAGKVMQRVKHRILYNKDVEVNLKKDLDSLSRKYVEDVVRTFESYFFLEDDIDQESPIRDPMVPPITNTSPKRTSEFSPEEGLEIYEMTREITSSQIKRVYERCDLEKKSPTRGFFLKKDSSGIFNDSDSEKTSHPPLIKGGEGSPSRQITVSQIKSLSPLPKLDEAVVQDSDRPSSREKWDNMFFKEKINSHSDARTLPEIKLGKITKIRWEDKEYVRDEFQSPQTHTRDKSNSNKLGFIDRCLSMNPNRKLLAAKMTKTDQDESGEYSLLKEAIEDSPNTQLQLKRLKEFVEMSGIKSIVQKSILRIQANPGKNAFELWVPNDETQFSKMFKEDIRYFCLNDLLRNEDISAFMQHFYELYYPGLFYVFLHYQSRSMAYPGLSWMEINRLMIECGIIGTSFTEADLDQIFEEVVHTFVSVSVKDNQGHMESYPERSLLRCSFMSYLARVAICRYYTGRCTSYF